MFDPVPTLEDDEVTPSVLFTGESEVEGEATMKALFAVTATTVLAANPETATLPASAESITLSEGTGIRIGDVGRVPEVRVTPFKLKIVELLAEAGVE